MAESGESTDTAFGDPRGYARQVAAVHGGDTITIGRRTVVGSLLGLVAIVLVPRALGDWLDGHAVLVSVGDLVIMGLLVALCLVLFLASQPVIRFIVDHRWAALLVAPVVIAVFVGVLLLLPAVVTTFPVSVLAAVGAAAVLGEVAVLWGLPTNEIVNPAHPSGPSAAASVSDPRFALALGPGFVGLMCLVTWTLRLAA